MAHSFLIHALSQIASEAKRNGDPMSFLQNLGPIHVSWHRTPRTTRRLGFLLFHWQVIQNFEKARARAVFGGTITPFSLADFRRIRWPYDVRAQAQNGDFNSLADFSTEIEGWHGDAHMAVGMDIGKEAQMMDPARNIFLAEFWRLHYFINDRFVEQVKNFDGNGTVKKQIAALSRRRHSQLGLI